MVIRDQISLINVLNKTNLFQKHEKTVNLFQNKDKNLKKLIVITNLRVVVFDFLDKEQEIRLNENIKSFNFDQEFIYKIISHFRSTDLILENPETKCMIQNLDSMVADQIVQLINNLKASNYTQSSSYTKSEIRPNSYQDHRHTRDHQALNRHKNQVHGTKHNHSSMTFENIKKEGTQKYCSHCGTSYNTSTTSCFKCGQIFLPKPSLTEDTISFKSLDEEGMKLCPYCTAKLNISDIFCSECGSKVEFM